jgi:hypothetical protein
VFFHFAGHSMVILVPTCNSHAPIATISLTLLSRYWANHPKVHVLHYEKILANSTLDRVELHDCGPQGKSSWLESVRSFLRAQSDDFFILLLDDYALCGPARTDQIDAGAQLMREEPSIGLFPLCWYPAARREPRQSHPGIVTLIGTPILLQAAIWRRSWFLELADPMDVRTSAWGFESAATQLAKRHPAEVCTSDIPEPSYRGGDLVDGFEKTNWPLPYHNLMHGGEPNEEYEGFLHREGFAYPSRGLGDTVARLARLSGVTSFTESLQRATGADCGCQGRRRELNRILPYRK